MDGQFVLKLDDDCLHLCALDEAGVDILRSLQGRTRYSSLRCEVASTLGLIDKPVALCLRLPPTVVTTNCPECRQEIRTQHGAGMCPSCNSIITLPA